MSNREIRYIRDKETQLRTEISEKELKDLPEIIRENINKPVITLYDSGFIALPLDTYNANLKYNNGISSDLASSFSWIPLPDPQTDNENNFITVSIAEEGYLEINLPEALVPYVKLNLRTRAHENFIPIGVPKFPQEASKITNKGIEVKSSGITVLKGSLFDNGYYPIGQTQYYSLIKYPIKVWEVTTTSPTGTINKFLTFHVECKTSGEGYPLRYDEGVDSNGYDYYTIFQTGHYFVGNFTQGLPVQYSPDIDGTTIVTLDKNSNPFKPSLIDDWSEDGSTLTIFGTETHINSPRTIIPPGEENPTEIHAYFEHGIEREVNDEDVKFFTFTQPYGRVYPTDVYINTQAQSVSNITSVRLIGYLPSIDANYTAIVYTRENSIQNNRYFEYFGRKTYKNPPDFAPLVYTYAPDESTIKVTHPTFMILSALDRSKGYQETVGEFTQPDNSQFGEPKITSYFTHNIIKQNNKYYFNYAFRCLFKTLGVKSKTYTTKKKYEAIFVSPGTWQYKDVVTSKGFHNKSFKPPVGEIEYRLTLDFINPFYYKQETRIDKK